LPGGGGLYESSGWRTEEDIKKGKWEPRSTPTIHHNMVWCTIVLSSTKAVRGVLSKK
jgi:hypothetical protein